MLPAGVKLHVNDGLVRAEGPKGKLQRRLEPEIALTIEGNKVTVARREETRRAKSLHGLTRVLEINGVGYRADARKNILFLTLGYSHPIAFQLPEGVTAKVERQVVVTLEGADRELLGQVAAAIRELRPPEPYKAKGVKYAEERIRRKAGKAAAAAAR